MTTGDRVDEELHPRQRAAAVTLALTGDPAAAARTGGCSERTLRRWRSRADFAGAVREAARTHAAESVSLLLAVQGKAVGTLRRALDDPSANVRVRAARALLELGQRAADDDLDDRIQRLEEAAWTENGPPVWSA